MEKIKHPMGEAIKEVSHLNKNVRLHQVIEIKVDFGAGGLISSMFRMALEISKRYDTNVLFELYGKEISIRPTSNIEEIYAKHVKS